MENASNKAIWIILLSTLFLLFSCASTQKRHTEVIDPEVYVNRGLAHGAIDQYDEAISDFTKALEINPRHALAYDSRAVAYAKKGEYDKAISDLTKAVEINPRYAEAYNHRGFIYLKTFKYDQAILDFTKALEIYPSFFDPFLHRGNAYLQIQKFDEAIHDLNKAIEINPNSPDPYSFRGIVYSRKYLFGLAILDFNKALEIDPSFAGAYYNRGLAYAFIREYGKSLEDFTKAQELGIQIPRQFLDDVRKRSSNAPGASPPSLHGGFGFWFSSLPNDYSIQAILEDGPAARAGLKIGDRILKINNADVTPLNKGRFHLVPVGEKWTFTVLQDGNEKEVELVAEELKWR